MSPNKLHKGKGEGTLIGIVKKISNGKTISNYDVKIRLEKRMN